MRTVFLLLVLMPTLAACGLAPSSKLFNDPGKQLEALEGPKVEGMNATLERSAIDSLEKGDNKRAGQFYKQLYDMPKLKPDEKARYAVGLAEASRRIGDVQGAIKILQKVLDTQPKNIEAMESMGMALLADGKAADAGRMFEKIMAVDPKRWRTLNALGILFTTKQMIPEALAYFTEALKFSADNPSVLNNVGLSYATERNFPRAREALEQASRFAAADSLRKKQIDLNMAMVLGISGDSDAARAVASKHLSGPALDNNLGLYAHLADNDELARAYLNTALAGSSTHYERAWRNLELVTQEGKGGKSAGEKSFAVPN